MGRSWHRGTLAQGAGPTQPAATAGTRGSPRVIRMLVTASTVKDSLDNVRFFVEANLASGVDHMLVFLDAPKAEGQPEVAAWLDAHEHVTCLPTGPRGWWAEDRPGNLNVRQRINVNWARELLEPFAWAEWLFHVDGDEVVHVDREALAAVPAEAEAVWLSPWEAVSQLEPAGRPTRFKRLLDDETLNLLTVLGALDEPTNQAYFHGHLMGKSGIRPRSRLGLTLHDAVGRDDGRQVAGHADEHFAVLHYDAVSGTEFIRKWSALARAGHARYRPTRAPMARALKTLVSRDLPEKVRERYLRRIYELTTQDDVDLLSDLGVLTEVDPLAGRHTPRTLPAADRQALADRVAAMREGPKREWLVVDVQKDAPRDRSAKDAGHEGAATALRRRLRRLGAG